METNATDTLRGTSKHAEIMAYISQLPGLEQAVEIGRQAIVTQYLTVVEMCGSLSLQISLCQMSLIDDAMSTVSSVLMMVPQSYRVSTVGGCSYEVREYPGCLFPFFLNVVTALGFGGLD